LSAWNTKPWQTFLKKLQLTAHSITLREALLLKPLTIDSFVSDAILYCNMMLTDESASQMQTTVIQSVTIAASDSEMRRIAIILFSDWKSTS
jgi:hypothetical protein